MEQNTRKMILRAMSVKMSYRQKLSVLLVGVNVILEPLQKTTLIHRMAMKPETFRMFCQTCGKEYTVRATETNPVCKKCYPGRLDFEPKKKGDRHAKS